MINPVQIAIGVFVVGAILLIIFRVVRALLPIALIAIVIFFVLEGLLYYITGEP